MRFVAPVLLALVVGCSSDPAEVDSPAGSSTTGGSGSSTASTTPPSTVTGPDPSPTDTSGSTGGATESGETSTGLGPSGSEASAGSTGPASTGSTGSTGGHSSDDRGATDDDGATESGSSSDDDGEAGDDAGYGDGPGDEDLLFYEPFAGGFADVWPVPWVDVGGLIDYGVDGDGRGWLRGEVFGVGRMVLAGGQEALDVDMVATLSLDDVGGQGVGLYVRQNGGHLQLTVPPGAGYVAFLDGFNQELGFWKEVDGIEIPLFALPIALVDGVDYRLRFQCEQLPGDQTELRARLWPLGLPEPPGWDVTLIDDEPTLQNQGGGFAVDLFNFFAPVDVHFDDIEIAAL